MTPLLDAGVALAKAALLRLRIAEKKRDLIPLEEAISHMDEVVGLFLSRRRGSRLGAAVVKQALPSRLGGNRWYAMFGEP